MMVRVVNLALFGLPTLVYLVNADADFGQKAGVFLIWASVMAFLCLRVWRPERARAGSNWLSVHDRRHWVELDKLTSLDKTGRSDRWVFYDSRHRRELLDVTSLRRCPILFDLLVRGVMRAEEAGTMQTKVASKWLMWSAPPGYRKPARWDSDG
jgi:hypothetical protein